MMAPYIPTSGLAATIETAWLPPVTVTPAGGGPGGFAPIVGLLKPKVTFYADGVPLYHFAPAGDPGPSKWPVLAYAALAIPAYLLVRAFLKRRRG